MKTDVVVIGSGGAGLSAALSAAILGAKVTVLERASVLGGTTAISGGGMWLPGNRLAAEKGFEDSEEETETYIRRLTLGLVSEDLILSFVHEAPVAFDFLTQHTPAELEVTNGPDYQTELPGAKLGGREVATGLYDIARLGHLKDLLRRPPTPGGMPALRVREMKESGWALGEHSRDWVRLSQERNAKGIVGRGCALAGSLLEACARNGVTMMTNARVLDLTRQRTGGIAVRVQSAEKSRTYVAKQGVVVASGGFEWNRPLWDGVIGLPLDGPLSPPHNEGDGLRMAMRAGARLGNLNQVWWMPSIQIPRETYDGKPRLRMNGARGLPGAIAVNSRGRRFGNEAMNYNDFGKTMMQFDPRTYQFVNVPAFVVFDRENREKYPLFGSSSAFDLETAVTSDWLIEEPNLRKLADKIGVDPDGLDEQVREFNRYAERGEDPIFHRGESVFERVRGDVSVGNPTLGPIGGGPYFAYALRVGCFGTKGGPVINGDAQILDFENQPIPGLYAAGNVTAGVFGPAYPGSGSTLGPAITFGYVAGRSAAKA